MCRSVLAILFRPLKTSSNEQDYQNYSNLSLAPTAYCLIKEIATWKWEFGAIQWTTHTSGKVIEDAGALRSGLCDLISLLPKVDYWQTDRQEHEGIHTGKHALKHTHRGTLTHIPECYQYTGMLVATESRGTVLRHSLNMQQAIPNKQENWWERVGVRASEKEKKDWLGICLKERVKPSQCLSNSRAIEGKWRKEKQTGL